ncbi:MAG: glycosyltransferase family 4 protein [Chloroflexota bacterium]
MNIAMLHYSVPPIVGGVESVMGHHARLMSDAGHNVKFIAGRGQQIDPRVACIIDPILDSRHEQVLEIKQELDRGQVPPGFEELKMKILQVLRKALSGIDLLIVHNVCSLAKNLPLTAALKDLSMEINAPPMIQWHHDLAWKTPRYASELHAGYPWDLLRTFWEGTLQVVVSELRRQELADLYAMSPEQIHVVPNGVDLAKFYKLETQTIHFIQSIDLFRAHPVLLLPVRITPRKNIEMAIRIVGHLRKDFPMVKMVVTGPLGPHNPANLEYFNRLTKLRAEHGLEKNVYFLAELTSEFLPDEVIADFYRLSDMLLFPSREEGFGIPILEAGLVRLPVFCTDISPLHHLGGELVHYFLADDKPEDVAKRIGKFLEKEPLYQQCVHIRREYRWETIYWIKIEPILKEAAIAWSKDHE